MLIMEKPLIKLCCENADYVKDQSEVAMYVMVMCVQMWIIECSILL